MPCVLTCLCANVPSVLMCSRAKVSCVLKLPCANVPCVFMALRANVPCVLTSSCSNMSCVLTCSRTLRAYVLMYQRPTCQHNFHVYMLTCQRAPFDATCSSFAVFVGEVVHTVGKVKEFNYCLSSAP